jgi:hypothetical protein
VLEFLIVAHVKGVKMIQDSAPHADQCATNPPDNALRAGLARIVGVSTFHTYYPKEAL